MLLLFLIGFTWAGPCARADVNQSVVECSDAGVNSLRNDAWMVSVKKPLRQYHKSEGCGDKLNKQSDEALHCMTKNSGAFTLDPVHPPQLMSDNTLGCLKKLSRDEASRVYAALLYKYYKTQKHALANIMAKLALGRDLSAKDKAQILKFQAIRQKEGNKNSIIEELQAGAKRQRKVFSSLLAKYHVSLDDHGLNFSKFDFKAALANGKEAKLIKSLFGTQALEEVRDIYGWRPGPGNQKKIPQLVLIGNTVITPGFNRLTREMHPTPMSVEELTNKVHGYLAILHKDTELYLKAGKKLSSYSAAWNQIATSASRYNLMGREETVNLDTEGVTRNAGRISNDLQVMRTDFGLDIGPFLAAFQSADQGVDLDIQGFRKNIANIEKATDGVLVAIAMVATGGFAAGALAPLVAEGGALAGTAAGAVVGWFSGSMGVGSTLSGLGFGALLAETKTVCEGVLGVANGQDKDPCFFQKLADDALEAQVDFLDPKNIATTTGQIWGFGALGKAGGATGKALSKVFAPAAEKTMEAWGAHGSGAIAGVVLAKEDLLKAKSEVEQYHQAMDQANQRFQTGQITEQEWVDQRKEATARFSSSVATVVNTIGVPLLAARAARHLPPDELGKPSNLEESPDGNVEPSQRKNEKRILEKSADLRLASETDLRLNRANDRVIGALENQGLLAKYRGLEKLNSTDWENVERAHEVGQGKLGKDGVNPAGIFPDGRGNYTKEQIDGKIAILQAAGLLVKMLIGPDGKSVSVARLFLDKGICGDPIKPTPYERFAPPPKADTSLPSQPTPYQRFAPLPKADASLPSQPTPYERFAPLPKADASLPSHPTPYERFAPPPKADTSLPSHATAYERFGKKPPEKPSQRASTAERASTADQTAAHAGSASSNYSVPVMASENRGVPVSHVEAVSVLKGAKFKVLEVPSGLVELKEKGISDPAQWLIDNGLAPKTKVTISGVNYYLSDIVPSVFKGKRGVAIVVEKNGVRTFELAYSSTSSGAYRILPIGDAGNFDKSPFGEDALVLPRAIQRELQDKAEHGKFVDITAGGQVLSFVPSNTFSVHPEGGGPNYKADDKKLRQQFWESHPLHTLQQRNLTSTQTATSPHEVRVSRPEDKPIFSNLVTEYKLENKVAGSCVARVFRSRSGLEYTFMEERATGRVWISSVEDIAAEINESGLRSRMVNPGDLTMPLWEYKSQIPDGYVGTGERLGGEYRDSWLFLKDTPLIREYYDALRKPVPP